MFEKREKNQILQREQLRELAMLTLRTTLMRKLFIGPYGLRA